jgi:hypothetical protein
METLDQSPRLEANDLLKLAAAAGYEVTPRLITDWVSLGLLDRPDGRGLGRGRGKHYTWAPQQGKLFVAVLQKHKTVKRPILANIPVGVWLLFSDEYVPLRQVRRAVKTWVEAYGTVSFARAKAGAQQTLLQLDHPDSSDEDREQLRRLLTQSGRTGAVNITELRNAASRVLDPHGSGAVRGPLGLLTTDAYVQIIETRIEGLRSLDTASDDEYYGARNMYLSTNAISDELRAPIEPLITPLTARKLAPPGSGVQAAFNNACLDLITLLGTIRLTPPTTPGFATKSGPPPPTWPQPTHKLKR